jgi:stage II sporulation protein D
LSLILILWAARLSLTGGAVAEATPETFDGVIRVGLESLGSRSTITLGLTGSAEIKDLATSHKIGETKGGNLLMTLRDGRVECPSLSLSSPEGLSFVLTGDSSIRLGKRQYHGSMEVWKEGKILRLVDETGLEDYVFGSLLIEGDSSFQPEALKALAVAIRTYAERSRGKHGLFDVCDTTHCQGFVGFRSERANWAKRAQEATAGELLTWGDDPIWSLYSTDCGGATANNEDVNDGSAPLPYLRGVSADNGRGKDYCASSPFHRWSLEYPLEKAEAALNRRAETRIGHLTKISVQQADAFGRAITLRLEGRSGADKSPSTLSQPQLGSVSSSASAKETKGEPGDPPESPSPSKPDLSSAPPLVVRTIRAAAFRSLLGPDRIKSTFFTVSIHGRALAFEGRGYGHGVGLCLFGSNGMAKAGMNYREILKRYYSGVSLVQLYEALPASPPPDAQSAPSPRS